MNFQIPYLLSYMINTKQTFKLSLHYRKHLVWKTKALQDFKEKINPKFDEKYLKKAEECIGWNVMNITVSNNSV